MGEVPSIPSTTPVGRSGAEIVNAEISFPGRNASPQFHAAKTYSSTAQHWRQEFALFCTTEQGEPPPHLARIYHGTSMTIAENLASVQERIAAACQRSGRSESSVRLMAVSKTHPAEAIAEAQRAGLRLFGENRVQEFELKLPALARVAASYHLIGPLQSNKAALACRLFDAVDTLDSLKLALRLNAAGAALDKTLDVLLEIKLSHEASKHGLQPASPALAELLEALPGLSRLRLNGLMTVPPLFDDPELARPYFRKLREMRDALAQEHPHLLFDQLSMGMSHDFDIAIEEGSTCVRIGTALFGQRPTQA